MAQRRGRRRWQAAGALIALALASPAARASARLAGPHAVARLLVAGSEPACPSAADLAAFVNHLLGRNAISDGGEDLLVYWRVESVGAGTISVFRLVTPDGRLIGTRAIRSEGPDCGNRRQTDGLTLALMLDVPRQELLGEAPPPRAPGPELALAAGSSVPLGWLPQPRPGLDAALSLRWGRLWPTVGFAWWPAGELASAAGAYRLGAWVASLGGAVTLWQDTDAAVRARVAVRAGRMDADGVTLPVNQSASNRIVDGLLQGEATARIVGPVWLAVAAGATVPILRPHVEFQDASGAATIVHRARPVDGLVGVSAVLHFFP